MSNYTESEDYYDTLQELDETERTLNIANELYNYYLYILTAIGIPANLITIITILSMQTISPATFFVATLAACDGLALVFKLILREVIRSHPSTWLCKVDVLPVFFTSMANWTLVIIVMERFVSVCFPLRKAYLITKRRSYIAVGLTAAVIFIPLAFIYGFMRHMSYKTCATNMNYFWFWAEVYLPYINPGITVFLPLIFIFIFTVAIVRGLRQSSKARRSLLRKDSGQNRLGTVSRALSDKKLAETERTERTITLMMIFTAFFFLVFSLPSCVFFILKSPTEKLTLRYARHELFKQVQYLLLDSTHALNFFLYVLTAKRFRDQLIKIICCKPVIKYIRKKRGPKQVNRTCSNTQITHVGI